MTSLRSSRIWAGCVALVVFDACSIDPLDLSEHDCPCPESEGWFCNRETNRCVREAAGPTCEPRVLVEDFRTEWSTPNAIFFRWVGPADIGQIGSYRIVLGSSSAVETESSDVTIVDKASNPELGSLHFGASYDDEPIESTLVTGLVPGNADQVARLIATDGAGCEFRSVIVPAPTLADAEHRYDFFVDEETPLPGSQPSTLAVVQGCGVEQSACLECGADCVSYQNVNLYYDVPGSTFLEADLSPSQLENRAFFEFDLSVPGGIEEGRWGSFLISVLGDTGFVYYRLEPFAYAMKSGYRKYQIRFGRLGGAGADGMPVGPITHEGLIANGIYGISVGAEWSVSTVDLDNVALRW